ncbi:MAG: hypothetical protein V1738_00490 [Patescibacteria group bacterium]
MYVEKREKRTKGKAIYNISLDFGETREMLLKAILKAFFSVYWGETDSQIHEKGWIIAAYDDAHRPIHHAFLRSFDAHNFAVAFDEPESRIVEILMSFVQSNMVELLQEEMRQQELFDEPIDVLDLDQRMINCGVSESATPPPAPLDAYLY